jgi:hypothetical protein
MAAPNHHLTPDERRMELRLDQLEDRVENMHKENAAKLNLILNVLTGDLATGQQGMQERMRMLESNLHAMNTRLNGMQAELTTLKDQALVSTTKLVILTSFLSLVGVTLLQMLLKSLWPN